MPGKFQALSILRQTFGRMESRDEYNITVVIESDLIFFAMMSGE
jgi:hypothetical protein